MQTPLPSLMLEHNDVPFFPQLYIGHIFIVYSFIIAFDPLVTTRCFSLVLARNATLTKTSPIDDILLDTQTTQKKPQFMWPIQQPGFARPNASKLVHTL